MSTGQGNSRGDLPTVSSAKGWLRDPQRFPVIVAVEEEVPVRMLRVGGQTDVIVYTGNNFLLNAIGWAQLRVRSLLSYVR